MGLFLNPKIALTLLVIHQTHFITFRGCIFSKLEKKINPNIKNKLFLQYAVKKIFNLDIKEKTCKLIHITLVSTSIILIMINYFFF